MGHRNWRLSMSAPTPHNAAKPGDIAKTVLMPGDPLRAKYVAETFLKNPVQFNSVRGMLGFTGEYEGTRVSVMGSGMGMPSIGIYSYELFAFYDVDNIIRIGTAGGIHKGLKLRDVVIASGASTNSSYFKQYGLPGYFAPIASFNLLRQSVQAAEENGVRYVVGNVLSSDYFYTDEATDTMAWAKLGVLAVEMESAALYMNAARLGKNGLGIFTISDLLTKGESTSPEERQTSFTAMMEIALKTACRV
jgi:purine-nucleoside phosphorylase